VKLARSRGRRYCHIVAFDDPASIDVEALFRDGDMFESREAWSAAGFALIERSSDGKIMVARHPAVRGLLFKKYANTVGLSDQRENYASRVEGSRRLRSFVDAHHLSRVVVPRKWLLDLPRRFSRKATAHVLVVEQLDLRSDAQTKEAYRDIEPAVLADLCVVLYHFRGMDSIAKNLPFVADGRIGLVDTEHWDRSSSKPYLHHVGGHMSSARRSLAEKIFEQLEAAGDAWEVTRTFDGEEDTSSSSSSSSS